MTTFLEFVCLQALGSPLSTSNTGESFWECPLCGSHKFHTRPWVDGGTDNRADKHRWACYRCAEWGDEDDLLDALNPKDTKEKIRDRIRALQDEYVSRPVEPTSFSPRVRAGDSRPENIEAGLEIFDVYDKLTPAERNLLADAGDLCEKYGVTEGIIWHVQRCRKELPADFAIKRKPPKPIRRL